MEKTIIDEEIQLDPKRTIVSETDSKGKITFCNDYFIEVCGYTKEELIGAPHNIIRHPDMPKIVFKLLWETIKGGKNINVVVKNRAKDGRYYWIFTEFETRKDADTGDVIGYTASRKTISKHVIEVMENLYNELLEVEDAQGIEASEEFLNEFLQEQGDDINFSNFMDEVHRFY